MRDDAQVRDLRDWLRRRIGRSSRSVLLFLMVLLLVPLLLLSVELVRSIGSHRRAAEGVLEDYAALAVDEFRERAFQSLEYIGVVQSFLVLDNSLSTRGRALPSRDDLPPESDLQRGAARVLILGFFEFDLKSNRLRLGRGLEDFQNPEGMERFRSSLRGVEAIRKEGEPRSDSSVVRVPWQGKTWTLVGSIGMELERPRSVRGFVLRDEGLRTLFERCIVDPLLPEALLPNSREVDPVRCRVRSLDDDRLWVDSLVDGETAYEATEVLDCSLGKFALTVSLTESGAHDLVAGGIPGTRTAEILLVILAAGGLLVATVVLLFREQQLARMRSDLVASVSHELRTPLAQIRLFAETLLLGRVRSPEDHQRGLTVIDREARRLSHQVERLLQFSRAERENLRIAPEPRDLRELVVEIGKEFSPLAKSRGVRLRFDLAASAWARVDGDAFRQVLLNLLDNAVKYGPSRQTVRIGLQVSGGRVRVSVEDEGPGISARIRDQIWEKYWQAPEGDRAKTKEGSGIGLYLVRKLVELHGGRVAVLSREDRGARFVVEVPRCVPFETPGKNGREERSEDRRNGAALPELESKATSPRSSRNPRARSGGRGRSVSSDIAEDES